MKFMSSQTLQVTSPDDLNRLVVTETPEFVLEMFISHFHESVYKRIFKYLKTHRCKDPWDHGQDISQETFIEVYNAFCDCYRKIKEADFTNPRGWVYAIAINQTARHYRKECNGRTVDVESFEPEFSEDQDSINSLVAKVITEAARQSYRADSQQSRTEDSQTLSAAGKYLAELPWIKRAAYILWVNGATHKQIAEELNLNEAQAKKMVWRVSIAVKKKLVRNYGGM